MDDDEDGDDDDMSLYKYGTCVSMTWYRPYVVYAVRLSTTH